MTENAPEADETNISPVVTEYERWVEHGKKFAVDQALHPATLNNIPWEVDVTPRKVAEFTLQVAKDETLDWVDDRKDSYWLEADESYDKARQVRREIRKILRSHKDQHVYT